MGTRLSSGSRPQSPKAFHHFAMVPDSFGVHAGDIDPLHRALREEFHRTDRPRASPFSAEPKPVVTLAILDPGSPA
jgi:hypothetical protein